MVGAAANSSANGTPTVVVIPVELDVVVGTQLENATFEAPDGGWLQMATDGAFSAADAMTVNPPCGQGKEKYAYELAATAYTPTNGSVTTVTAHAGFGGGMAGREDTDGEGSGVAVGSAPSTAPVGVNVIVTASAYVVQQQ